MEPPEVDFPKLRNLSLSAIVKGFKKNAYAKPQVPVNPKCSQIIFDAVYLPHLKTTPEVLNQIRRNINNVSSVVLGRNNFDESHRQMVYSVKTLKKLALLDFRTEENFWLERPDAVNPRRGRKLVDIIAFLKECVCPESRETLKELCIRGYCDFPRGWISELHDSFPAIHVLETTCCGLTNEDFVEICEVYPGLTELYISGTRVNNLNGLEKLTELKTLSVGNLNITNGEFFLHLNAHQNLEFLDLSFRRSKDRLKMFYYWLRPSQNLKTLDLSGNHLDANFMVGLHTVCPQLEIIAIDTFFFGQELEEFFHNGYICYYFESDKFFEELNFEKCISLLELFKKNAKRCYWILLEILYMIRAKVRDPNDIKKIVKFCIDILKHPWQNFKSQSMAISCFCKLWRVGYYQYFSRDEKIVILEALYVVAKKTEWKKKTDFGYRVFLVAFDFLFEQGWKWGLDKAEVLWDLFLHAFPYDYSNFVMRDLQPFLYTYKKPIDLKNHLKSSTIIKYKQDIMGVLRSGHRDIGLIKFRGMLNFLAMLLKSSDLKSKNAEQNRLFAENLFLHMHYRDFDEPTVIDIFECLEILYPQIPDERSRRKLIEDNLRIIERIFLWERRFLKIAAAAFCMQCYKFEIEGEPFVPYTGEQLEQMQGEVLSLILENKEYGKHEMLQKIEWKWFEWRDSGAFDWIHETIYRDFDEIT